MQSTGFIHRFLKKLPIPFHFASDFLILWIDFEENFKSRSLFIRLSGFQGSILMKILNPDVRAMSIPAFELVQMQIAIPWDF